MTPVFFATTADGETLPIIDVTHPVFAVSPTAEELATLEAQYLAEAAERRDVPPQLRAALADSRLGRGLLAAQGGFLSGLTTYMLKLGAENVPAAFQPIDRRIAASFPAFTSRLRLQDMADLMSSGLADRLAHDRQRPLHLLNIAGGVAADSWNALMRLRAAHASLSARPVAVTVLDLDAEGPAFGRRAFETLQSAGAPLQALAIRFEHLSYNWSEPGMLSRLLGPHDVREAICGVSSEGGLFEYGSGEEIVSNLSALHDLTAPDAIVVGSVTRDNGLTGLQAATRITTRPRTRDAFRRLAENGGWRVEALIERSFSDHVRMVKR